MQTDSLLRAIWNGWVDTIQPGQLSSMARLLDELLSVPTIILTVSSGLEEPMTISESTILTDGATLGDVLCEEMDVDVPDSALILFLPAHVVEAGTADHADMARLLGSMMLEIAAVTGFSGHSAQRSAQTAAEAGVMYRDIARGLSVTGTDPAIAAQRWARNLRMQ